MNSSTLDQLRHDARVWIFGGATTLDERQRRTVSEGLESFVAQWTAHGSPLSAAFGFTADRFVIVGVNPGVPASGCSIDRLFRTAQQLQDSLGIPLLDSSQVVFKDASGEVTAASREDFAAMARAGVVSENTIVFDQTIETIGMLREGHFEKRAADSWHGSAFQLLA